MIKRIALVVSLGAGLALAACDSGPSSSAPARPSEQDRGSVLERQAEHIEGLLARRPLAGRILDELTSALPDRVRLTEVVYGPRSVQVKGSAPSNNLLADYLSRLGEIPLLASMALRGSVMKTVRGREQVEFTLQAAVPDPVTAPVPAGEIETVLPALWDEAGTLRELQMLALDAGLQMTKFAPGSRIAGEFTGELPVSIEVAGGTADLRRYLRGLADLGHLWIVERFSCQAVSAEDPRSRIRASISARAFFPR